MNMKKLISTALVAVMLFTGIVCSFPLTTGAAYSTATVSGATLTTEEIKDAADASKTYTYKTAQETLDAELAAGYLDHVVSPDGKYTLYINRYLGYVYYVNNTNGQILTSNPVGAGDNDQLLSQLIIRFTYIVGGDEKTFDSFKEAARRGQLSLSKITGGIRVSYTIGDTTTRFLLPERITHDDFVEDILRPMINTLVDLLNEYATLKEGDSFEFFGNPAYAYDDVILDGRKGAIYDYFKAIDRYISAVKDKEHQAQLKSVYNAIVRVVGTYDLQNPGKWINYNSELYTEEEAKAKLEEMYKDYPITKTTVDRGDGTQKNVAIFTLKTGLKDGEKKGYADLIRTYCHAYSFSKMYAQEEQCGYVNDFTPKPIFRMALEYTLTENGELSVRLPANSISFDETLYQLNEIRVLPYFGCNDRSTDGYIFNPDGSGTIIENSDFYNTLTKTNINLSAKVYGPDYCHANITGQHREQIVLPVFGMVNRVTANEKTRTATGYDTVTNGFLAVLGEGASLATLKVNSAVGTKFVGQYASYTPYPMDTVNLSDTISFSDKSTQQAVGTLSDYNITADVKYNGSYVISYKMLTDPRLVTAGDYTADYVGMATYYRDYLKADGTLTALSQVSEDLPLYIETLGMMTVDDVFLSFPIEREIALTTFADVETMFSRLHNATAYLTDLRDTAAQNAATAAQNGETAKQHTYESEVAHYETLLAQVKNINNINFKLTGYYNEGLYPTYPVKLRWERVTGGAKGFRQLVSQSAKVNEESGVNFGVYPDFDFLYIYRTKLFDGITTSFVGARTLDNRYAAKSEYDSVSQRYFRTRGAIISTDEFDHLLDIFIKRYGKYDIKTLAASSFGSELNSNLDENRLIFRETSMENTVAAMDKLVNANGYQLMVEKGNLYSLKYATHILRAEVDSSHSIYSSYTIPFVGMVLHGSVNYAGNPINYSGTPSYEILRAIESGASLYYIMAYQNIGHMKEKYRTSQYYSVDFANWYESILTTYAGLNAAIGDLQTWNITGHVNVKGERIITDSERLANYEALTEDYLTLVRKALDKSIADTQDAMFEDDSKIGVGIRLTVDVDALLAKYRTVLYFDTADLADADKTRLLEETRTALSAMKAEYEAVHNSTNAAAEQLSFADFDYIASYQYLTVSDTTAEDYVSTEFTCGNVVLVTYTDAEGHKVEFLLNYNIFAVNVNYNGTTYLLDKYDFQRIG